MPGRCFLDTNIFVYSFDRRDKAKQDRARSLIRDALRGNGCTSWQVVQEFCNVALKGFAVPFDQEKLREYLELVLLPLSALYPDRGIYQEALGLQWETRFSWYDSLILAAAARLKCTTLYTEDLSNGRACRGVTIVNPFL